MADESGLNKEFKWIVDEALRKKDQGYRSEIGHYLERWMESGKIEQLIVSQDEEAKASRMVETLKLPIIVVKRDE